MFRILVATAVMGFAGVTAVAGPVISQERDVERAAEALQEAMRAYEDALAAVEGSAVRGFGGAFGTDLAKDEVRTHRLIKDPEALRGAARDIERAIEDEDVFESLAEMLIMLSRDVEVVERADSVVLAWKGDEIASVEQDGEDRLSLRAGGRKLTLEVE